MQKLPRRANELEGDECHLLRARKWNAPRCGDLFGGRFPALPYSEHGKFSASGWRNGCQRFGEHEQLKNAVDDVLVRGGTVWVWNINPAGADSF